MFVNQATGNGCPFSPGPKVRMRASVADVPQRHGINQIDMPRHQRGKRFIGLVFRVLLQQCAVIRWLHFPISVRHPAKTDNLFAPSGRGRRAGARPAYFAAFTASMCQSKKSRLRTFPWAGLGGSKS